MRQYTIADFAVTNHGNDNLGNYNFHFYLPNTPFIFDIDCINKNWKIFKKLEYERHKDNLEHPRTGDIIFISKYKMVYACHCFSDRVQTTAGGSFSIHSNGSMSYSGGLQPGISREDLILTEDFELCKAWFPEGNNLRAHCAVYAEIKVRVWTLKKGANLSGVWESTDRIN